MSSRKCYNNKVCYIIEGFGRLLGCGTILPDSQQNIIRWSAGGGPTNGLVRAPVMSGSQLLRVNDRKKWRRCDSETKQKHYSKYAHILLPNEFEITFYIIQLNWLCLNYNLVSLSHLEASVA